MKIGIASDHAGFDLKETLKTWLTANNYTVEDFGTHGCASCDYPDFAHPLAAAIESGDCTFGVAICGSGNGINMTVNKHQGIRSALCWDIELASLAREHNNANILALPARFISQEKALELLKTFLATDFEGGRHQARIDKIACK